MDDQDMVWVRFTSDYDAIINPRHHMAIKADIELFVKRSIADDAVAKGAGQIIDAPGDKKVDKAGTVVDKGVAVNDRSGAAQATGGQAAAPAGLAPQAPAG